MSKTAEPVEMTQDEEIAALKKQANKPWRAPEKGEKLVKLTLHKPEGDQADSQFVSVNFRDYLIRYGEEVTVPQEVVDMLKNTVAVTVVQDPQTEKLRPISRPRFAFNTEAV